MLEILNFYVMIIGKIFGVYISWEVFPGVNYLSFVCAAAIMTIIIVLIYNHTKAEINFADDMSRRERVYYKRARRDAHSGRHVYQAKHGND